MPELSANLQFLLQTVRWRVERKVLPEFSAFSVDDEANILMLAIYHNLIPWLWYYLDEHTLGSDSFRQQVAKHMRKESLINQLQAKEAATLSSDLAKRRVKHIVFKGVNIQALFYNGFVEQRYCDDIDLLIAPQDLLVAASVFTDRQYVLREPQDIVKLSEFLRQHSRWYRWRDIGWEKTKHGGERLDLHWRLADKFILPVDTHYLLSESESVSVNGVDIPCMPFSTLFVYVCVHGHMDHFFRLRYLVDIYCALHQPAYDADQVTRLAQKWGVLEVVTQSISLANRFFSHPVSEADAYSDFVIERFNESQSFPRRSRSLMATFRDLLMRSNERNPLATDDRFEKQALSAKEKMQGLLKHVQRRNRKKSWVSPIIARCKYDQAMLEHWPKGRSALVWYPIALIKRCFK